MDIALVPVLALSSRRLHPHPHLHLLGQEMLRWRGSGREGVARCLALDLLRKDQRRVSECCRKGREWVKVRRGVERDRERVKKWGEG